MMIVPSILLLISLAGAGAALLVSGFGDLILVAGPCVLASLYLLGRAYRTRRPERFIIIDGSNVMHWKDGTPQIDCLRDVVESLIAQGYTPGVVFDANVGHLIAGRYQHDGAMCKRLGLAEERVMVVPKGQPADPAILEAARELGAQIVTNDRYRDWAEAHPEVTTPGHLIRGGYRDGKLWLALGINAPPPQRNPSPLPIPIAPSPPPP
jgi:Zc3h12a-like Ribonuclease NYN domain